MIFRFRFTLDQVKEAARTAAAVTSGTFRAYATIKGTTEEIQQARKAVDQLRKDRVAQAAGEIFRGL